METVFATKQGVRVEGDGGGGARGRGGFPCMRYVYID